MKSKKSFSGGALTMTIKVPVGFADLSAGFGLPPAVFAEILLKAACAQQPEELIICRSPEGRRGPANRR